MSEKRENWVKAKDIIDRYIGDEELPTDEKINIIITDVEFQVLNRFPNIQNRINSGLIDLEFVISTISRWITEYLSTGGKPYVSETQTYFGAASRSVTLNNKARVGLKISYEDLSELSHKVKSSGIGTITMTLNNNRNAHYWSELNDFWNGA